VNHRSSETRWLAAWGSRRGVAKVVRRHGCTRRVAVAVAASSRQQYYRSASAGDSLDPGAHRAPVSAVTGPLCTSVRMVDRATFIIAACAA